MSSSINSINQRILAKLQKRNQEESLPFVALVDLSSRLLVANAHLATERDQFEFVNGKLKEENQRLVQAAGKAEPDHEQVSLLEKKLFNVQEELTELHRRKGQNAQQIIDQSAQIKELEVKIADLQSKLAEADLESKEDAHQKAKLKAIVTEVESTNQLLRDEYQTLQLALSTAERKLLESQKENDKLIHQIMEFKERDVLRLNQENDKALRMQQERIKQQLEEAVAETKSSGNNPASSASSSTLKSSPFNFFRLGQDQQAMFPGRESLDSAVCHSVRIPTRCFLKFEAHDGDVNAIKWSPRGLTVATGGSDRKVKIWDISKNMVEQRGSLSGSNGAVFSLDHDIGGSLLLAASSDFASRIWSVDDQRLRHTLTGHSNKVLAAKFIDSTKVVSASYDRTIKVWDLRSKACVATKFPGSSCNDIVHSDHSVISAHFDKKIRFWDLRKGDKDPIEEIELGGKITSLDISKNGHWLLACCRDDSLRLIDLQSGCQLTSKVFATEGFQVACDWTRASFTPDSEYVSVGSANGKVYIWRLDNCVHPEKVLSEHSSPVISLAWQPAGNSLTSCDKNKTVVVWAAI